MFPRFYELFHEKKLSGLCRRFGVVYYVMFKLLVGVLGRLILNGWPGLMKGLLNRDCKGNFVLVTTTAYIKYHKNEDSNLRQNNKNLTFEHNSWNTKSTGARKMHRIHWYKHLLYHFGAKKTKPTTKLIQVKLIYNATKENLFEITIDFTYW